jgi:glutamate/tyrosine decarboxylase-like PLP-dependent enzyme
LFQPYEIGCVLVRDRNHLRDVFHVTAEYLREAGDPAKEEVSFFDYGIQMTRNARALKLWMSLKVFGLNAFRQAVARGIELAELAEKILRQSPDKWEIVTPAQLGVVTFRYRASGKSEAELETINRHIVARITAEGYALVLSTALKGRDVLRICAINPRTTDDDIRETIRRLEGFGDAIVAEQGRDKASTI